MKRRLVETCEKRALHRRRHAPFAFDRLIEEIEASCHDPVTIFGFLERGECETATVKLDAVLGGRYVECEAKRPPLERHEKVIRGPLDQIDYICGARLMQKQ